MQAISKITKFAPGPNASGQRFIVVCFMMFATLLIAGTVTSVNAQSIGAFSGFKSGGKSPIQIEADRLEVIDKKAMAIFQGNVKVVQGGSVLKADKLKVFYIKGVKGKKATQGNSIKKLEVSGTVYIRSEDNEATSNHGSFNMITEDVELAGNVVLTQGKNIMTGCQLRANLKTGIAKMISNCSGKPGKKTGRVKMLFEPSSKKPN
jgi:lipopolysaccharide export system protein LptA